MSAHKPCSSMYVNRLTIVACTPGLISIIAGDSQYPLLYGRAVDVLDWAGGLEVLFDGLVHHQVLELSELGADVRKPSGAHVGRLAHPAGKREQGVAALWDEVRALGKERGAPVNLAYDSMRQESSLAKTGKVRAAFPTETGVRGPCSASLVQYRNHHPSLAPTPQQCERRWAKVTEPATVVLYALCDSH